MRVRVKECLCASVRQVAACKRYGDSGEVSIHQSAQKAHDGAWLEVLTHWALKDVYKFIKLQI